MIYLRDTLASIHPLLPYLTIALLVGLAIWLWRTYSPRTFELLPPAVQSLPAVLLSAVLTAASSGSTTVGHAMVEAVIGALSGLVAVGGHEALRRAPVPYLGGRYPAAGTARKYPS